MRKINFNRHNSCYSFSYSYVDHLLESSPWDDSNKWSYIGLSVGICIIKVKIRILSGALGLYHDLLKIIFHLLQGVIRDEGDLDMLGNQFKDAYSKRQIDPFDDEAWDQR